VYVEVEDTGAGIERRQWGNVFRPGFSTKQRGWGLGLSLARRVVEVYHGGTLELVESTVGEGSTFRVELPD
jgi:signal transduction histidine kinase